MSCSICGRNNCTVYFHSIEEQQEHKEKFGEQEDKICELKDENKQLNKKFDIMMDYISDMDWEEIEEKIECQN